MQTLLMPTADRGPYHTPWDMRSARAPYAPTDFLSYVPTFDFTPEAGKLYTLVVYDPLRKVDQGNLAYLHGLYTNVADPSSIVVDATGLGFVVPYVGPGSAMVCFPGCESSMLGDGTCDPACNNDLCDFDYNLLLECDCEASVCGTDFPLAF